MQPDEPQRQKLNYQPAPISPLPASPHDRSADRLIRLANGFRTFRRIGRIIYLLVMIPLVAWAVWYFWSYVQKINSLTYQK